MKPAAFTYHAPTTLDAAVALLAQYAPEEGRVLAGGQSLVPAMAMRLARPGHLIDINGIAELATFAVQNGKLAIGACVRHQALDATVAPGPLGRLFGMVCAHIAHPPIRARGTFCGSLAHADAASEWCLLAVALGAEIEACSQLGIRRIVAEDFFHGYMSTALEPDEMILRAHVPLLPDATRVGFYEFARRAGDFAQVMALVTFEDARGRIANPRVALGGLEARPRRSPAAEAALAGQQATHEIFAHAAQAAAAALGRLEDDAYGRALAESAVLRALMGAE